MTARLNGSSSRCSSLGSVRGMLVLAPSRFWSSSRSSSTVAPPKPLPKLFLAQLIHPELRSLQVTEQWALARC